MPMQTVQVDLKGINDPTGYDYAMTALKNITGVQKIDLQPENHCVIIQYDDTQTSIFAFKAALKNVDYISEPFPIDAPANPNNDRTLIDDLENSGKLLSYNVKLNWKTSMICKTINTPKIFLGFLLIVSTGLSLTACEKNNSTQDKPHPIAPNSPTALASANATTPDSHAGHDMSNMATMPKPVAATRSADNLPPHIADYTQSMNAMHNKMMVASQNANPDIAFAAGMIPHHQGAIDMANIELKYGKDSQMRTLATNVIQAQQSEIIQMQRWLDNNIKQSVANNDRQMPEMDMASHTTMMQGITDANPDIAFAKGMIPHHQMAIQMAEFELKNGKDTKMLALAKQIKNAQDPEISQMQAWLSSKGQ